MFGMMNAEHTAAGRKIDARYLVGHFGGFPLRLSWLPRLIERYGAEGRVPSNLEIIACDLGVGKNMAKSMRAWGRAAGLLRDNGEITRIATQLFGTYDRYLERGESVALLHWLIASNSQGFTTVAWAFNFLRRDVFSIGDAVSAFKNHLASDDAEYADGTLRGDMEAGLRMHTTVSDTPPDDSDDRFFSQLRLLSVRRDGTRSAYSRTWEHERAHVSEKLLLHALLQSLARRGTASSALSELHMGTAGRTAPGVVFGLSRDGFFAMVERLDRTGNSGLSLSTMPGEDALLTAHGNMGGVCVAGDLDQINERFFGGTAA